MNWRLLRRILIPVLIMLLIFAGKALAADYTLDLYTHAEKGWGDSAEAETNPGPTIHLVGGDTITLILTATDDNLYHRMFIDLNNNSVLNSWEVYSELFINLTGDVNIKASFELEASDAGTYIYRDSYFPENWGMIVVTAAPGKPWFAFRVDPFYIFGLGMTVIMVGYFGVYLPFKAYKYAKLRHKMTDIDARAWAKVILNPDGPIRPMQIDIDNARRKLLKKKRQ